MIIGITGSYCSGKDTVAEYLVKKHNFIHYSLSDILREELKRKDKKLTRDNLIKIGNTLREKFGYSILAKKVLEKCVENKNYVISSIRHPAEIEELKKRKDFYLIDIKAPAKLRFKRMLKRNRYGDVKTFKDFLKYEKLESQKNGCGQQLELCKKKAIKSINNTGNIKNLYSKVDKLLAQLQKIEKRNYKRPSWDEYFMKIAKAVGERGTCDRGRAGAVIVKDKRIIATGYVGAPMGLPHCDEIGHLMCDVINPNGTKSKHCIRTAHAEQNAIVQAALHGVSTKGATLYVSFEPCFTCAKMIINAGIKRVVCEKKYHAAELTRKFFKQAGVKLVVLKKEVEKYPDQE